METVELMRDYVELTLQPRDDFPFKSCVASVDKLTGGLINFVYRVRFASGDSVVVKHTTRYMSSNRTVELNLERYFVEKAALIEFGGSRYLRENTQIRVPRLYCSDDEAHLLVMEDAGEQLQTLFQILQDKKSSGDETENKTEIEKEKEKDQLIDNIGHELFNFTRFLREESGVSADTHWTTFRNQTARELTGGYLRNLLSTQVSALNMADELAPFLPAAVELYRTTESSDDGIRLIFGDLWPNSVLYDVSRRLIWIVDWEMCRFAPSSLRDLEQLMGNLWIMEHSMQRGLFDARAIRRLVEQLQLRFFGDAHADWRLHCGPQAKAIFVVWVVTLLKETHWGVPDEDKPALVRRAIAQVNELK